MRAGLPRRPARRGADEAPQIILFPERPCDENVFIAQVKDTVERVSAVAWWSLQAEAWRSAEGKFVACSAGPGSFGHRSWRGRLASPAGHGALGFKVHWTLRLFVTLGATHRVGKSILENRRRPVGGKAAEYAVQRDERGMTVIVRVSDAPYRWTPKPLGPGRRSQIFARKLPAELHPRGRLRHPRRRATLPAAADPWRGTAAVWADGV